MQFRAPALFVAALVVAAAANPVPAAEQVEARQIGEFVTSVFGEVTSGAVSVATQVASGAESVATGVATTVASGATGVFDTVTSGAAGAFTTATSGAAGIASTITSVGGNVASTVSSGVTPNAAVGSINAPAYLTPVFMLAAGIAGVGAVLL